MSRPYYAKAEQDYIRVAEELSSASLVELTRRDEAGELYYIVDPADCDTWEVRHGPDAGYFYLYDPAEDAKSEAGAPDLVECTCDRCGETAIIFILEIQTNS